MDTGSAHPLGMRRHPLSGNRFCKFTYLKGLHGLATAPQLVLRVLADYADENGRKAHPGIPRLAADCSMGESTVRRHLKWLEKNGYVVQESRGHNVGNVALASVYSLTLPDLPLTGKRKRGAPTAQSEAPTAQSDQTYRSNQTDLPLTGERLPDPLSDPFPSDPSTSDPDDDEPPFGNEPTRWEDEDPPWGRHEPIPGPHPFQANTIDSKDTHCHAAECTHAPILNCRWCPAHVHLAVAAAS
jgi:hypothetical protein